MKTLLMNAYAKINIGLEILNKRTDGYHNINTIFSPICLSDSITINENKSKFPKIQIECTPSLGIPQEQNLAYKAAKLLIEKYNVDSKNIKILIQKKIPLGAGLGGGSSDAAAVLLGLVNCWNLPAQYNELQSIANQIGSDVPYFLNKGTAVAGGRGELLDYFDYKIPFHILIVMPAVQVSTKWAYQNFKIEKNNNHPRNFKRILLDSLKNKQLLKELIINDFESTLFAQYPELTLIKETLYKNKAVLAQLSGSGSAIYGFFESIEDAEIAKLTLNQYQTYLCPTPNN